MKTSLLSSGSSHSRVASIADVRLGCDGNVYLEDAQVVSSESLSMRQDVVSGPTVLSTALCPPPPWP